MQYLNKVFVTAQSLGADFTSDPIQIEQYFGYAITAVCTGASADGTIKLQGSVDPAQNPLGSTPTPVTFVDIGGSTGTISGATNVLYNVSNVYYNWVRLVFTRSSGTGSITATINAKGY